MTVLMIDNFTAYITSTPFPAKLLGYGQTDGQTH